MTLPRELSIEQVGKKYLVASKPVNELKTLEAKVVKLNNINSKDFDLTSVTGKLSGPCRLKFNFTKASDFSITLSNSLNQKLVIGFDQGRNQFYIDRTESGKVDFEKDFASRSVAPRFVNTSNLDLTLIVDNASVELFADNGLTVMTEIFFPVKNYSAIKIETNDPIENLEFVKLKSIYHPN